MKTLAIALILSCLFAVEASATVIVGNSDFTKGVSSFVMVEYFHDLDAPASYLEVTCTIFDMFHSPLDQGMVNRLHRAPVIVYGYSKFLKVYVDVGDIEPTYVHCDAFTQ